MLGIANRQLIDQLGVIKFDSIYLYLIIYGLCSTSRFFLHLYFRKEYEHLKLLIFRILSLFNI